MKILYIDQFGEIGGAQKCMLDLLPAFRSRGWQLHAALPGDGPLVNQLHGAGVAVETIPCGPYRSGLTRVFDFGRFVSDQRQQARVVARLSSRHNFDLIYVNGPRVLAGAQSGAASLPILFHAHNHVNRGYTRNLVGRCLAAPNVRTVACCESVGATLRPYVAADRIQVIPNGAPALPFRKRFFEIGRSWRVGMIGRIQTEKGQMELVEAAASLLPALPNLRIVLCGDAARGVRYEGRVRRYARHLPLDLLGWRDDIGDVVNTLDLLVIASKLEGLPRVMLEAFSAGLPVLAFATGGISEAIEDNVTGFLVKSRSPRHLELRILELASGDLRLMDAVAERARRLWERHYNIDIYRERIMDAVERAAKPTSVPRSEAPAGAPVSGKQPAFQRKEHSGIGYKFQLPKCVPRPECGLRLRDRVSYRE